MNDELFMKEALRLARQGMLANKGGPFGAVVVRGGQIIGRGYNRVTSANDPTAHAEMIAIREACKYLEHFHLKGCTIYTSAAPCPMCMGAIYWAHLDRLVFGASQQAASDAGFDDQFIYEELNKPLEERRISIDSMMEAEVKKIFQEWENKEDKITY